MIRSIVAAGSVALALSVSPALAQQSPAPEKQSPATPGIPGKPAAQKVDPSLVGLSVYSSDGQKVGQVAEVGMSGGVPAVRAEMGQFLGMGAGSVIIHADAFARKPDRIEVAMTADQIKDTISKQRQKKQ